MIKLAFDRDTVREFDKDGRLHVKLSNISKATVNPYLGKEIPGFEQLGLDANKVYKLLRDPKELEKAVSTFNGLPLLIKHKPTTAIDHQTDLTVGSLGTDAVYEHPYLKNSLVIWPIDAIEGVEDGEKKELSAGYRYTPDMTPGTYEGETYDGVMRNIIGNHVALVSDGRAGPDVVVGDSNPFIKETETVKLKSRLALTAKGALFAYLAPRMAQDAKLDISSALADVNAKNFKTTKAGIVPAIQKLLTKGKLAQDASPEEMQKIIDLIDKEVDSEEMESDEIPEATDPSAAAEPVAKEGVDEENPEVAKIMAHLKEHHPEAHDSVMAMRQAKDEPPEFPGKPKLDDKKTPPAQDADKDEDKKDDKEMVDKPAMDAAIKTATEAAVTRVKREQKEIRDAERAVAPYVGTLAVACDSAAEVYRHALKTLGMDAKEVDALHESALPQVLKFQNIVKPVIAQDQSYTGKVEDFSTRYPEASRIRVVR
jgi:uncharacterized protein